MVRHFQDILSFSSLLIQVHEHQQLCFAAAEGTPTFEVTVHVTGDNGCDKGWLDKLPLQIQPMITQVRHPVLYTCVKQTQCRV
jgi:hypothetical protein